MNILNFSYFFALFVYLIVRWVVYLYRSRKMRRREKKEEKRNERGRKKKTTSSERRTRNRI